MPGFRLGRPLAAAVAILLGSAAAARADIQIAVQEYNLSDNTVVASQLFTGTGASLVANFNVDQFVGRFATAGSNSDTPDPTGSMTTNVNVKTSATFDGSKGLRVIATDDGFIRPPGTAPAVVTNTAGVSTGLNGGVITVTALTNILKTPLTNSASQTAVIASGTSQGATPLATSINTDALTTDSSHANTQAIAQPPLGMYAIQETITIQAAQSALGSPSSLQNKTFGATAGSTVTPSAVNTVPAPPALLLGLLAVPALVLRRFRG